MERRPATYQDVIDADERLVAELLDGELFLWARLSAPHLMTASALGAELNFRFDRGRGEPGEPGGWVVVDKPELWLDGGPVPGRVLVPDVAAWRRDRFPHGFTGHGFTVLPDVVIEVLSPSTFRHDRYRKADAYAQAGIPWMWLVDPLARSVEVHALHDAAWLRTLVALDADVVCLPPFEGLALDVGRWWPEAAAE